MLFWRCLMCVMLAGGVACGLARSDSWQLMVEAGLDGPDRRITPKSVFIAPVHASRSERCRPGFRYDHLGRCVKVVRVDANAQVHLFLKHLQGSQGLKTTAPLIPSAPSSNGPLQFSLPIAKVEETSTESPTTTTTTTTTSRTTTIEPTIVTTISEQDLSTGQKATTISSWDQTIPTLMSIDGSGSGDQATTPPGFDGSGEEPTEDMLATMEGSGSEATTTEEERDNRSTTTSSEEAITTDTPFTVIEERTPIPPNNTTAALIMAILRGIKAWKSAESTPPPLTKHETNNTILIPLETIQLNLTESQQVPLTTTERTEVSESVEEDSVIKYAPQENKVQLGSSWVRFPDDVPEYDSLEITPQDDDFHPRFRFPEENVDPEQRPTILKFWSQIPMYTEEVAAKSDEQWTAP